MSLEEMHCHRKYITDKEFKIQILCQRKNNEKIYQRDLEIFRDGSDEEISDKFKIKSSDEKASDKR